MRTASHQIVRKASTREEQAPVVLSVPLILCPGCREASYSGNHARACPWRAKQ
jgi:hypothetical protein